MQGGIPEAYADFAQSIFARIGQPSPLVTRALDVAEAVWRGGRSFVSRSYSCRRRRRGVGRVALSISTGDKSAAAARRCPDELEDIIPECCEVESPCLRCLRAAQLIQLSSLQAQLSVEWRRDTRLRESQHRHQSVQDHAGAVGRKESLDRTLVRRSPTHTVELLRDPLAGAVTVKRNAAGESAGSKPGVDFTAVFERQMPARRMRRLVEGEALNCIERGHHTTQPRAARAIGPERRR
jgi:hypothetical protein